MLKRFGFLIAKLSAEKRLCRDLINMVKRFILKLINFVASVVKTIVNICFKFIHFPFRYVDAGAARISKRQLAVNTPVKKKVMFLTFQGDYTCNPKAIAEEMIRQGVDCELVWDIKGSIPHSDYPLELRLVKHGTFDFYKELASSKVIIENTNIVERLGVYKKKNQYLFQTWHGSLGIKRLDGDVVMGKSWKKLAKRCQKSVDYLLSNSDFETEVFETAYWEGVPSLRTGHARNDIFFMEDKKMIAAIRRRVYRFLDIDPQKKIFLFAPTHRDNLGESFHSFDYAAVKEALEERFGGEWQIVLRFHNSVRRQSRKWMRTLPDYVSDATMYGDMQELLLCTEVGVTDYSSWIFDYVLGKKPGFIVEMGLEQYEQARGFYYPLESTPFPIAKDFKELCKRIRNFDEKKYQDDIVTFLEARGCMEDGHASERIVAKIKELLDEVK